MKLCGCLPFYLPYSGPSVRYCNLTDSFCLQKHRGNKIHKQTHSKKIIQYFVGNFTKLANLKIKFIGGNINN